MTCGNTDARSTPAAAGTSPSRASQRGQRTGKRNMGDARAADGRTARALLLADLAQVRPVAELGTRERRRVERDGAARRREVELGTRGRGLRLRLRLVALAHQLTAAAIAGDLEGETVLRIHRALSAAEARDEARCARLAVRLREVELRAWRRRRDLQRDLRLGLGLGFSFTVVVIAVGVLEQVAAALALLFETRVPPCGTALQAAADGEVNLGTWCLGLHLGFIVVVVIVVVVLTVRGEQVAAAVAFHRAHT